MNKLEDKIKDKLLPTIIGRSYLSDEMRKLYSLPAKLGGLGFQDPSAEAEFEYQNSIMATAQLTNAIYNQLSHLDVDVEYQRKIMSEIRKKRAKRNEQFQFEIKDSTTEYKSKLIDLSSEKGASSWLTSVPLKEYGFRLNKQEFHDAIAMRYDFTINDVSKKCACGEDNTINHCLTCKKGGFIFIRHNAVRDTTHELLNEVCKDVRLEPILQPVTGETLPPGSNKTDGARADVSALSF